MFDADAIALVRARAFAADVDTAEVAHGVLGGGRWFIEG
jgi:hypothetical protein